MLNLSEQEKAYIAGMIDGEGCICISKCPRPNNYTNYNIKLFIASTDFILVEWFLKRTIAKVYAQKPTGLSKRICYKINFQNQGALDILKEVSKYMVIKKRRVDFVLKVYPPKNIQDNKRRAFVYDRLKSFNQRELVSEDSLLIPSSNRAESEKEI